jgi:hypothetical protein
VPFNAPSSDLVPVATGAPSAADKVWRHPTKIIGYLLKRELVGENQIEGGVTRFLARAGDWVRCDGFSLSCPREPAADAAHSNSPTS